MNLRQQLYEFLNSSKLPEHDSLLELADKAVSLLENEDSTYRPKEKSDKKFSGGLLDFRGDDRPIIVIPDLHGRGYFLMHLLDYQIQLDGWEKKLTVLEALEKGLVYVIFVGDLYHSELRGYARWKKAYLSYSKGQVICPDMISEMLENLNLLQMVITLKLACPRYFHFLKGNHENILNEEGRGNHAFHKMVAEGAMVYRFMSEQYGDALLYILSCLEHCLPLCAVFDNLVVSHAEPAFVMNKTRIINYRNNPNVVLALTWTPNDGAETGAVSKSIKNLVGKNCRDVVWIGGHRPIKGTYAYRQRKKYIQIHNPDQENVALVMPGKKFDPETGMISVAPAN